MSVAKKPTSAVAPTKKPSVIQGFIDEASQRMPKYKSQIQAVGPYVILAADSVDKAYPYAVKAYKKGQELWEKAQPYHPEQYGPLVVGLAICFFGGSYVTIIAAIEAVRFSVWQRLWAGLQILYQNYSKAEAESRKDDLVDDDGNGIADVQEITDRELFTRKAYLFARTVDPRQVSDATAMIWSGCLAVIATLRVHFAQAVTLGNALGEMASGHLSMTTRPVVEAALPKDLKRWSTVVDSFAYTVAGVILAWFLSRAISGFHAALRGANMFVIHAIDMAKARGLLDQSFDAHGPKASAMVAAFAALGFYWQLCNGFGLPFPLNVLFFPVTIVEWLLTVVVGVGSVVA